MELNYDLKEISAAAERFIANIGEKKCFAFHGEMGAGKTTFINTVCHLLGAEDNFSSPTFSIINEYGAASGKSIYHLDLYRLKDAKEAMTAGVEDCLFSGSYCFVEWPEKAPEIFPSDTVHCYITTVGDHARKLQINL